MQFNLDILSVTWLKLSQVKYENESFWLTLLHFY